MISFKDVKILKFFAAFSLIVMLAACSSSNDGPVFNPDVAPQNVQVVSGDDNTTDVRNTISWTRDPTATGYVVYVGNVPGVDESSSVVVPADSGFDYVTHSGLNDVVAGNTYYYRVQAVAGDQSSILSAEVTGTPQESITANALNDVAWNGTDTLVAVGAAGVILNSPNGVTGVWVDNAVNPDTDSNSLSAVTWESFNSQFLIVGAGGTVLSSKDGSNWSLETTPVDTDLEDVTWLGDRYIAVGKNGAILTSDGVGSVWTSQASPIANPNTTLNGVASNDKQIVVAVGTAGTILTSADGGASWTEQTVGNNILNDITWDGNQFGVVASDDTVLSSTDGVIWTEYNTRTPDINFVAASQWDYLLPIDPLIDLVLGAVGSNGTYVVSPDATTGFEVPTGTKELLSGMTWVDDGVTPAYFVIVGNDGTVLTSQLQ
jgi:photosystem II stability/assembly factor-like uncharacterized protein